MSVGIYKQRARDVMTKAVATIREQETVHDALSIMTEHRLTSLPVVDSAGRCVGIVSQSDLIDFARELDDAEESETPSSFAEMLIGGARLADVTHERIDDVMSDSVVTVTPNDPVVDVADKMLSNGIHHVPVCDADRRLLGIVSTMDILGGLRTEVSTD